MPHEPRRVKLLHVTTVPLTLRFFRGQVGWMKARGLEVHALSSPGELLQRFGAQEGVPVHAVEMPRRITPLGDLGAIWRTCRLLLRLRPEIVHAHTPKGGLLGMIAACLTRTPVRVYHIHGLPYMTATGVKRRLLRSTERISCRLAHQVLCVSRSIQEVAVRDGICPASKIKVLLGGSVNGVDAAGQLDPAAHGERAREEIRPAFGIPPDALVVGFVGRIVRDKGLAELAEAWKSLREQFPRLHLLVVGPFEPQDPVPPEVEELLRGDDRIHLTGQIEEVAPFYAAMDVLALPTYREGFGLALVEAAAMLLPVVATRIPGCVDAVEDGVTGTLVPVHDAQALAAALRQYLEDPALRREHGRAGRRRVLHAFRQEILWEALHQEYGRLLTERGFPSLERKTPGDGPPGALSVISEGSARCEPVISSGRST